MCYTNFEIWPYRGCAGSVENPPLGPCMGGEKGKIDTGTVQAALNSINVIIFNLYVIFNSHTLAGGR